MEKIKILILDNNNGRLSHMAAAFLHSFDKDLCVRPAGIKNESNIDHYVTKVMKNCGIDISDEKGLTAKEYISQNWDYVIIINNCANAFSPVFRGTVLNRIYINFNDDIKQEGTEEFIHYEYTTLRDEIRTKIFDFYLNTLYGKDILGADGCSNWCDIL